MTGLGATPQADGSCTFLVWAPKAARVEVRLGGRLEPLEPLEPRDCGYHEGRIAGVSAGDRYAYVLDGGPDRPDPASRHQPEGVHGASAVVDPAAFRWSDGAFRGPALRDLVLYELHIGTFTSEGTFAAAAARLRELRELGVTAVEPLPIAQFPGSRNWGYDGVLAWAAQDSYGGPEGLRSFVDAAHAEGLAVILDVVYNHLGPEGAYLGEFGHYFTERYTTPWGAAVNFDGPHSDEVRRYFIESALMWIRECHIDGFRLDAVHAIADTSARPFLAELTTAVRAEAGRCGRAGYLIAESDQNDVAVITPTAQRGLGFDATWSDDFHHSVHALLTGERSGYYADFGTIGHLAEVYRRGWAYTGGRSAYRRRRHGSDPEGADAERFVVAVQNHDQVGNRARGERLTALVDLEARKLAAGALLLSPFTPLLFMGEEYGETRPFLYFTSHGDETVIAAVRSGRRDEFREFAWRGEVPDPQDERTFRASILDPARGDPRVRALYAELLRLRRELPELVARTLPRVSVAGELITLERERSCVLLNFGGERELPFPGDGWHRRLDTADERFGGPGCSLGLAPRSALLLVRA